MRRIKAHRLQLPVETGGAVLLGGETFTAEDAEEDTRKNREAFHHRALAPAGPGAIEAGTLPNGVAPVSRPAVGADSSPHPASTCADVDVHATADLEVGATPLGKFPASIAPGIAGARALW